MEEKYKNVLEYIKENFNPIFQSKEIQDLVNFCLIENNFSYLETLKDDFKYKQIIEKLFIELKKIENIVALSGINYIIENKTEVIFNIWFTVKEKHIYTQVKMYYDFQTKTWSIK